MARPCPLVLVLLCPLLAVCEAGPTGGTARYVVDDGPGLGRYFDGVGAISGGGATSKLLMNYDEVLRNQILDYLFKPNFGASLHILKVEIGGDSQSTDGVEASHMHSPSDQNYDRGYEWWLMAEAKKRNPSIKLYGLPWVFPGWLGGDDFNPYSNRSALVGYIVNWVQGAWFRHSLQIDYVGIWNERAYDTTYIKMLRAGLDQAGFNHLQIVVADGEWGIMDDLLADPQLRAAVGPIGVHYPGSHSPLTAQGIGHPLWASEEYSATNDLSGGGCWARVLCGSYVNGYLSGVIAWNLITSYYDNLPYPRSSLMVANQPWGGHYEVNSPIWMTAHVTQFSFPGWEYLLHGSGVGTLALNGSYVALTGPDNHLTIIIETMAPKTSPCFYSMPKYTIEKQSADFVLQGNFAKISQLRLWRSYLDFVGNTTEIFQELPPIMINDGSFTLELPVNSVFTLTTLPPGVGVKGSYPTPPSPKPFPATYREDFEGYPAHAEPFNLAPQAGSFEVMPSANPSHCQVLVQTVPRPPVDTCRPKRMTRPVLVFGNFNWADVTVRYDFSLGACTSCASGVFLAARVDRGGCGIMYSNGLYLWASGTDQTLTLTGNHTRSAVYAKTVAKISLSMWHTLTLAVKGPSITASLDGRTLIDIKLTSVPSTNGFLALGTEEFATAYFDNVEVLYSRPAESPTAFKYKRDLNI